ncbi:MAG TPA: LysM peptidoglycan-binding domain-containing protein, partial [Galbitalea sp.]
MSRTRHSSSRVWTPRRTAAAAIRAGAAAVTLVVLMVGPPVLLLRFVGNPIAGFEHFSATRPLTDVEVKGILALVIWLAWAQLVACVLSETAAQIRGFTIPASVRLPTRVPLTLGIQQRLARQLVVAVLAFVSLSPTLSTVTASTAPVGPVATASYQSQAATPAPAESPGVVVVAAGQDLESIAQTHLGSAQRWPAIWELNRGSAQPGGQRFTDPDLIRPGWTLQLPAPSTLSTGTRMTGRYVEVTVQPGESLWSLAETHLGAGERYHEIWKLTAGLRQADGRKAIDPAKIRPGWTVRIPAAAGVAATAPNGGAPTAPAPPPVVTTDAVTPAPGPVAPQSAAPTKSTGVLPATAPTPDLTPPTA